MKTGLTIFLTLLIVAASAALYYFFLKSAVEARSTERIAEEKQIREKYGDDVIIS